MKDYFHKHIDKIYRVANDNKLLFRELDLTRNEKITDYPHEFFQNFIHSLSPSDFKHYPLVDPLYYKLSKHHNVEKDNILITPGSDTALKTVFEAIDMNGKEVLTTAYAFPMYDVYASMYNAKIVRAPYEKNRFEVDEILNHVTKDTKLIVIANPNSPLGDYHTIEEFKNVLDLGIPTLIDEAYIELTTKKSFVEFISQYKNLIITRTFSKGFGAAGCRIGYIISDKEVMNYLNKYRFMFEVNNVGVRYTEALLDQYELVEDYIKLVLTGKQELVTGLVDKGVEVVDTDSSWFFIKRDENQTLLNKDGLKFRYMKLPEDKSIWCKFNYDPIVKTTNLFKEICG